MDVKTVLEAKGPLIFSVKPDSPVSEAVQLLHEKNIGAVIVMEGEGDKILGILSERDVIRIVAEQGIGALQGVVADAMTRSVVACTSDSTLDTVIAGMSKFKVRHLPVFEDDELLGLISARDVMRYRIQQLEFSEEPRFHRLFSKGKVYFLGE